MERDYAWLNIVYPNLSQIRFKAVFIDELLKLDLVGVALKFNDFILKDVNFKNG